MLSGLANAVVAELDAITVGTIATLISLTLGGNASLLVLVQYLFLLDAFLLICTGAVRSITKRVFDACKKYISLYLGVILVGVGTKAFDVAIHSAVQFKYSGSFFFDLFIYTLIVYELVAINRHLARWGFAVSIGIQTLFKALINTVCTRLKVPLKASDVEDLMEPKETIEEQEGKKDG